MREGTAHELVRTAHVEVDEAVGVPEQVLGTVAEARFVEIKKVADPIPVPGFCKAEVAGFVVDVNAGDVWRVQSFSGATGHLDPLGFTVIDRALHRRALGDFKGLGDHKAGITTCKGRQLQGVDIDIGRRSCR